MSTATGQGSANGAPAGNPQVFISYSSDDRAVAEKVCRLLERDGITCWIAPRDISPGHDYGEQIIDAIQSTRVMVLILSANANASVFVKKEVERAISTGKVVVPLRIQDVQPSKALQLFVSSSQWIDAWTPPLPARVHVLAAAIKGLLGLPALEEVGPRPTGPLVRPQRRRSLAVAGSIGLALVIAVAALIFSGRLSGSASPGSKNTSSNGEIAQATGTKSSSVASPSDAPSLAAPSASASAPRQTGLGCAKDVAFAGDVAPLYRHQPTDSSSSDNFDVTIGAKLKCVAEVQVGSDLLYHLIDPVEGDVWAYVWTGAIVFDDPRTCFSMTGDSFPQKMGYLYWIHYDYQYTSSGLGPIELVDPLGGKKSVAISTIDSIAIDAGGKITIKTKSQTYTVVASGETVPAGSYSLSYALFLGTDDNAEYTIDASLAAKTGGAVTIKQASCQAFK
jgi:hypothetical protein